ncbi:MAG: DNA-binding protein [Eubacterium sp.]|nr:DNA-binding protein [Eubacterium sp.]
MEKFVEQSYLYDFYGELLTEHQKRIYQEIVFDDFSEAEVARDEGISRQGVHDLMKRCQKTLEDYEKRLHLVEKFLKIRDNVRRIQEMTEQEPETNPRMKEISRVAAGILDEI